MTRHPILFALALVVATSLIAATALAQGGPPPADAEPGAPGVTGPELGALEPVVAPGYRLRMVETVFAPGSYVTAHTHASALVVCVQAGALGFSIQHGAATIARAGGADAPESTEPLALNAEVVLEPRDCVSFDEFATHTIHTAWNASEETTVLWEAHLHKADEPFTTFVNEHGTPVPTS
jgi:hypothetical protein